MRITALVLLVAPLLSLDVFAVKQEDFKQCHQSSFCRRLRALAGKQEASRDSFKSPYTVGPPATTAGTIDHASWSFPITSSLYPGISFELRVDILEKGDGIARIRMDEVSSKTAFKRYNETAKWALVDVEPSLASLAKATLDTAKDSSTIHYGKGLSLEIVHSPLKITQMRDGKPEIIMNERSLLHMEHFRSKTLEATQEVLSESEQMVLKGGEQDRSWFEESDADMFEERFRTWTDSKPKGPEGLSLDLSFPGVEHIYGLPEHASPLSLPDTVGPNAHYQEPYRLFNVDIFEYLADSPMALYGAIPLVHAHSATSSVGVLNLVGSDTWVDVLHDTKGVHTHWVSESGILDLLLLPGPRPQQLFEQYAVLTGTTALPAQWAIAYHQCRWNYIDEDDVLAVDRRFDEADIPLDVTWLDVEYTVERRYFDWNKNFFPDVKRMLGKVAEKGRKMVAIIDPHVKKADSYRIYTDSKDLDILIKNADGTNFEGWCWPGNSVWVDFFNPNSWEWWNKMFDLDVWADSAKNLFIWNDMNEPSVFNGPEISVPRDVIHDGGWENRDVHNINGMLFHNATAQALIAREIPAKRPFVLSRSFFAGSQRYGAIWTGDNMGEWGHLAGETAMLLSLNIAGMSFSGADVGGFFGDPAHEMLVRWYQAGAFMPFFRAHAHIDTKRREPFLYDEPIRGYLRDTIRLRYQLLPVWYNAFHDASVNGVPIIRPQYAVFPEDKGGFAIDDQYYVGDSGILVKPVTKEGAISTDIYIADNQPYYNYFDHKLHPAASKPRHLTLDTPLSTFPVLIQGGSIFPTRQRVRRSSPLMWQDPFTLTIALSREGSAKGQLYLDDGETFGYEQGEYIWRSFDFVSNTKGGVLRSTNRASAQSEATAAVTPYNDDNAWAKAIAHVQVERLVVLGMKKQPKTVTVAGQSVEWTWEAGAASNGKKQGAASKLVVKSPGLSVVGGWEVKFE